MFPSQYKQVPFFSLLAVRVSFVVIVTLGALLFFVRCPALYTAIQSQVSTEDSQLTPAEQNQARGYVYAYLSRGEALPQNIFSEQEIIHMYDVKALFDAALLIIAGALILLVIGGVRVSDNWLFVIKKVVETSRYAFFGFLGFFGVLLMVFPFVFESFHRISFQNEYWLLDPSAMLIRLFPLGFFELFAWYYFVSLALIFFLFSRISVREP